MLLFYRPLEHCMAKQLCKAKIKCSDFTKGGADIVDQLNDYYTTRSKSYHLVMVALLYMLNTARKTVWCLNNDLDISSASSYDFSWNLA